MQAEACKHIEKEGLEDTFYIIDLGNVQRMYKVKTRRGSRADGGVGSALDPCHTPHLIMHACALLLSGGFSPTHRCVDASR